MKKTNVTISFDEKKLTALRLYMEQKDLQLEDELTKAMEGFYGKHVPSNVRDFIEMRSSEPADPATQSKAAQTGVKRTDTDSCGRESLTTHLKDQ